MSTETKYHAMDADTAAAELRYHEFETPEKAEHWIRKNRTKDGRRRAIFRGGFIQKRGGEIRNRAVFTVLKTVK